MKYIIELEDEPNESYFGEGNFYRCKQIPYWSISESMRNRLEPYDEADRKDEPTISKMEQVDEPQTEECPFDDAIPCEWVCPNSTDCPYKQKTEPQTETEIAKAIVHKMIDDAVIAEDAYPDLRQKMHDAVDNYEPQTDCAWR